LWEARAHRAAPAIGVVELPRHERRKKQLAVDQEFAPQERIGYHRPLVCVESIGETIVNEECVSERDPGGGVIGSRAEGSTQVVLGIPYHRRPHRSRTHLN
jgi:hypothetical protein